MPRKFPLDKLQFGLTIVFAVLLVGAPSLAQQGDGIAVGKPKIFDNRALSIMLEQLKQSLAQVQVVDQKSLAESLGLFQGSQINEVSRSLSVSTLPLPAVKLTEQANSSGELLQNQRTTDRAAVSPSAPMLPDALAAPNFQPKYGPNASDLLSDQVNLSYQIFNLRMLLERSLSDRLWQDPTNPTRIGQRLQAVIGFDVTIDPPKDSRDSAAVVEITIAPKRTDLSPVSLVAMMPQEKTYNATALNNSSNAFGGSAVVKMITIGYSERRRGQVFYLYRDSDTISVERLENPADTPQNAITFGWEFRPVLGRKSVSPGSRQVFAVVALPDFDQYLAASPGASAPPYLQPSLVCRAMPDGSTECSYATAQKNTSSPFEILVWRRVYWRKYDSKALTTSTKKKEATAKAVLLCRAANPCSVPYTATIQGSLQPHIRDVQWVATDDKNAAVTVAGDNFFAGTSVYLGGAVLDSEKNGLLIKSEQDLTLRTTLSAIATGDAVLNGRYAGSIPIKLPVKGTVAEGVEINSLKVNRLPGRTTADLFVNIEGRGGTELVRKDFTEACNLLVLVGNTPLPPPYYYRQIPYGDVKCDAPLAGEQKCVEVLTSVPAELLTKDTVVKIKCPFRGNEFEDSSVSYDPSIVRATILGIDEKAKTTTLVIAGASFDRTWQVELDQTYEVDKKQDSGELELDGKTLLVLRLKTDVLKGYKNLLLLPPFGGEPIVVPIPTSTATPEAVVPKLTCAQPISVELNSSRSIVCSGEGFAAITSVTFENTNLTSKPVTEKGVCVVPTGATADKTECIRVYLSRRVTRKVGPVEVLLHTKDDKTVLPLKILVQATPTKPAP
jgi:hypothetical protein